MARYIDADELKDAWAFDKYNENLYIANQFIESIDDQPTADVAPVVHAHWVYPYYGTKYDDVTKCSKCNNYYQDKINNIKFFYRFCPHCGARMDEKENEQ